MNAALGVDLDVLRIQTRFRKLPRIGLYSPWSGNADEFAVHRRAVGAASPS